MRRGRVDFVAGGLFAWAGRIPDVRKSTGGDFRYITIGWGKLYCMTPAYPGCPGKEAIKWMFYFT